MATMAAFEADMMRMWAKPIHATPFTRDFGRLVSRVRLVVADGHECREQDYSATTHRVAAMVDVVKTVRRHLMEVRPIAWRVLTSAQDDVDARDDAALDMLVLKYGAYKDTDDAAAELVSIVGASSPTIALVKLIHQNVVLAALCHLHAAVSSSILLKDVRSPDGWQIHIRLDPTSCQLVHVRKEQSVDTSRQYVFHPRKCNKPFVLGRFVLTWEVRCIFPRAMNELTSARLRITDLAFAADVTPDARDELRRVFVGDLFLA
ncbi:Aste57867_24326 [Aphanomyces stellatus]|uniref:Aste57867_24326 protein n=1 Tax=Aphanomyces stellatus TaxID=120398 RepID=A0A485LR84_9STRA|nr:hypothetical protein As57867_024251 [Aphanomyces stellatus]VFU00966.1 Aste57867_24326 [Aphanomyces stellatus]